jgi:hypothetical protein
MAREFAFARFETLSLDNSVALLNGKNTSLKGGFLMAIGVNANAP